MLLIIFALLASIGGVFVVAFIVAWYRGLLSLVLAHLDTLGDILTGREIIIHKITLEELMEYYDEDDEDDDDKDDE